MNKKEQRETVKHIIEHSGIKDNLDLDMSNKEMIDLIIHYIETHKWLLNEKIQFDITCDQAIFSWHENVYFPLLHAMRTSLIFRAFPEKRVFELFSELSDAHFYATEKDKWIAYEDVIKKYILENSTKFLPKLLTRIFY